MDEELKISLGDIISKTSDLFEAEPATEPAPDAAPSQEVTEERPVVEASPEPEVEEAENPEKKPATEEKPVDAPLHKQYAALQRDVKRLKEERAAFTQEKAQHKQQVEQLKNFDQLLDANKKWGDWFERFKTNPAPMIRQMFPGILDELQKDTLNPGTMTTEQLERRLAAERDRIKRESEGTLTQAQERARQEAWAEMFRNNLSDYSADPGIKDVEEYLSEEDGSSIYKEALEYAQLYLSDTSKPEAERKAFTARKAVDGVVKAVRAKVERHKKRYGSVTEQPKPAGQAPTVPKPVTNRETSTPAGVPPKASLNYYSILDIVSRMDDL